MIRKLPDPFLLNPGDFLQFVPITEDEFESYSNLLNPGLCPWSRTADGSGIRTAGVPVSGAMDLQALRIANILTGNRDAEAGIEITWGGFRAEFLAHAQIAVTGADPKPRLNGRAFPCWSGIPVRKGDVLELNYAETGCRSYVAISGGVDVPEVMGSKSTYLRGGFGGHMGRALQKGDVSACSARAKTAHFAMSPGLDSEVLRSPGAAGHFGAPGGRADAGKSLPFFICAFCRNGSLRPNGVQSERTGSGASA